MTTPDSMMQRTPGGLLYPNVKPRREYSESEKIAGLVQAEFREAIMEAEAVWRAGSQTTLMENIPAGGAASLGSTALSLIHI